MKKAGGIIALIAGVFGVGAAIITFSVGGLGAAFEAEGAGLVIRLGFGGLGASFLSIVLGAIMMNAKGRIYAALLILCALAGIVFGGTLVAVPMVLALVGGILGVLDSGEKTPSHRTEGRSDDDKP